MQHLLVSLTAHGFGHAAMTAPVVNAVRQRFPHLKVTLQSDHPPALLASRFASPVTVVPGPGDFGLRMASATAIDLHRSAEDYRALHDDFDRRVDALARQYRALAPDLLLANIPYLALAAAGRIGMPAIALSCLNWADLYHHYFGDRPEAAAILAQMRAAYDVADLFLCPAPSMPMPRLNRVQAIGPIAPRGSGQQGRVRHSLGIGPDRRLGLVAFGGVDSGIDMTRWARLDGWSWVAGTAVEGRPDIIPFDWGAMTFTDLLQASDLVVGKPGYGTFTEAAVNGVPVLYVDRPDWPESPGLVRWLSEVGRCRAVEPAVLFDADGFAEQLRLLFSSPIKPLVQPTGISQAVEAIVAKLKIAS
jgi:hypothetical protein